MGFNIKNFLFEEEGKSYEKLVDVQLDDYEYTEESKVEVKTSGNVSQIEDIYSINNLNDLSKSVYKVEEIKSVLPNTLPTAAKKESVLGMMQVSNITVNEVVEDTNFRKDVLTSVLQCFTDNTVDVIETNTKEIQQLEDRINELKESINARKVDQEQQEKIIKDEISKVDSIIEFII